MQNCYDSNIGLLVKDEINELLGDEVEVYSIEVIVDTIKVELVKSLLNYEKYLLCDEER